MRIPTIDMYSFLIFREILLGNAKLDGLVTQLGLTGDRYNVALVSETADVCLRSPLKHGGTDNVYDCKCPKPNPSVWQ